MGSIFTEGFPRLKEIWKNCVGLQIAHPLCYFKPSTLQEVVDIIKDAEDKHYKVKAVGSGHSFSDVALTRDYLIDTHSLDQPLPLEKLSLHATADPENLYLTECGIVIHELNNDLDDIGKALPNMGAYDGQTIIGAISTSTHGSGITLGPLPSLVEALILVGEGGEVFHIERTNGISTAPINLGEVPVKFIQNDDIFLSSVVSMGCLGVVYAVVLRVCDAYMLKEERIFCKWDEVKGLLEKGDVLKDYRHYEVLINAYKVGNAREHTCLITRRHICPPDTRKSWARLHRSLGYELAGALIPAFVADAVFRFFFNKFPKLTPAIIQMSIKTLRDGCYIQKSFKVLDLGSANNYSGYCTEIAFQSDKYLDAVQAIFDVTDKIAGEGEQFLTSPFALRFVKTTDHYLSMQTQDSPNHDFVCMIEFPILNGTIGGVEMLARIEAEMYKYGGRPHWGQYNHVGIGDETLANLYPKYPEWIANYKNFSPNGTFQNDFTERCGIVS